MPAAVRLGLALLLVLSACESGSGDDGAPSCVEIDVTACALLYPATYEQVWSQTLAPSCSGGGSACHPSGAALSFQDAAVTYDDLLDGALVIPGDPGCSPLMIRLESDDPSFRMPPGSTPIHAGARCSIANWIANGAAQD